MVGALVYAYLGGWIVMTIGVALAAMRLQDHREPAAHPHLLSIVAGAVWPLLVVALAQTAVMALTHEVLHTDESKLDAVA